MTTTSLKVKVVRKASIKLKVIPVFPANIVAANFVTLTRIGNIYTLSVDYSVLTPGPISDPTTAYVAINDVTSGVYRNVALSSLLTSSLDADLQAIAALTGTGILARTAANTWVLRTITGTANEITVTNGDGVSGAPTLSLPTALTFTGKTVTGGTFTGVAITSASYSGTLAGGTGLPISTGVSGLGTGIATALGVNVGSAGAPVINGGVLGTPSSGTATNLTGLPLSTGITGAGTGVLAALAVNVGTAGSIVVNGGALGTPASGVATNLTGTAAGLTAGTVTTNANLTGPVTSVGNATTIGANQVSRANLAQGVARSVIGVTGNATANVADIQGTANQALVVNSAGTALAFGAVNLASSAGATGVIQAASFPALTGDVTTVSGALASTIAANAVTNAKMATMAAFTFKGNNTAGSATPTDVDIAALTAKASPAASDYVMISDQAASGAWKRATVSSIGSAGSVASYNTRTGAVTATGTDVPLRGYLSGLTLSTAGSSQVFSIAAGACTDSSNTSMMALSAFTKTAVGGGTWVVGSGNGVLDTGAYSTNTWYHAFVIQRPDTGVVDVAISLSASAPTTGGAIPAAYTLSRRIGSLRSGGVAGQWVLFHQLGDEFLWDSPVADVSGAAIGTTALLTAISVPTGVQVLAMMRAGISNGSTANTSMLISSPDVASQAVGTDRSVTAVAAGAAYITGITPTRTNTSAQLRFVADVASSTYYVGTYGWIDRRGRDT